METGAPVASKEQASSLVPGERSLQLSAKLQGLEITVSDACGELLMTKVKGESQCFECKRPIEALSVVLDPKGCALGCPCFKILDSYRFESWCGYIQRQDRDNSEVCVGRCGVCVLGFHY